MGARTRGFANNVLTSGKLDATDGLTGNLASTNFANATVTNIEELPPAVGSAISSVAGNPAAPVAEGKIWYNTSTDSFNIAATLEAWSSGASLITARQGVGGAGTQDAALAISGRTYPAPYVTNTEEYNGSGWASGGATSTARIYASTSKNGSQTACFIASGQSPSPPVTSATEEYDGSSWTAGGTVNTARGNAIGFGTLTAGVMAGSGPSYNSVEEYNGTAWTTVTPIGTARYTHGGSGLETAGLIFGGAAPGPSNIATTEEYDGTSWTAGGDMNTARNYNTGFGIQSNTTANGGGFPSTSNTVNTENYDGTTWTNKPDSANTRWATDSGFGTSGSTGGVSGALSNSLANVSATEEYNVSLNVITAAAWASGGNLNTARRNMAASSSALQTAGIVFGGTPGVPIVGNTEEYNGTSWSEQNDLNTARRDFAGAGTQTATLAFGGGTPTAQSVTEEYDGTSWTEVSDLNTARPNLGGTGTQTAALAFAGPLGPGTPVPSRVLNESWDGTSWTEVNDLNTPRSNAGGIGTQTAALAVAGGPGTETESWDGTSWTVVASYNTPRGEGTGEAGIQTAGLLYSGTPNTGDTEGFDGTAWSTRPSMTTARSEIGYGGTQTAALAVSGSTPGGATAATEEFTGETSALNVESLTTS